MESVVSNLFSFLSNIFAIDSNPLIAFNHLFQAYFFSLAVCNLVAFALKLINFSYAEEVAGSRITQIIGIGLLFYLKIWDYYSGLFYIASIFSLGVISLYVYDCCGNISEHYDNISIQRRDIALIVSVLGMFSTTMYILWQIYKNPENPLYYPYSGVYVFQILVIVIGGALRKRSILYSLLGVFTINLLIILRYLLHDNSGGKLIDQAKLPVQYIVYFLMAIDAEKRERTKMNAETYKHLFKTCAYLAAYSLLNEDSFQLELFLGGCYFVGLIRNR